MEQNSKKAKILKLLLIAAIIGAICLAVYLPLKLTGALDTISSLEDLKTIILGFGIYGYLVFFLIQILQATILPLPAAVTTLAGVLVFGPVQTFFLSLTAIMVGSLISFTLGRLLGKKLLVWVAGEQSATKWEATLSKGKFTFFIMMLFPFFPDDILCIVAGMTNMTYRFFIITNLIARPITLAAICFFGGGVVIPFSGWGIPVWIVLGLILVAMFYCSIKYQAQIEKFALRVAQKLGRKNKKEDLQSQNNENPN